MSTDDVLEHTFGMVPSGDQDSLREVIRNAVRNGFAIVLCKPGTKEPLCPLTARQAKQADNATRQKAKDEELRGWDRRRHPCGIAHAITEWTSAADSQVKRAIAEHGTVNVGVELGRSGYVVVDVDTMAEREAFVRDWTTQDGRDRSGEAMTVHSPGALRGDTGEWIHKDGGHYWFRLPAGRTLPPGSGALKAPSGWCVMWHQRQVLVPPSVRPEGTYRAVGPVREAPAWLLTMIELDAAGRHEREKRNFAELDPDRDIDAHMAPIPWSELLEPDGWTLPGSVMECGCPNWTAPGGHASPKSATAHDLGCTRYDTTTGHGPLRLWTDNPPEWLAEPMRAGTRTFTKLQYVAWRDHEGSDQKALVAWGLNRERVEVTDLRDDLPSTTPAIGTALDTGPALAEPFTPAVEVSPNGHGSEGVVEGESHGGEAESHGGETDETGSETDEPELTPETYLRSKWLSADQLDSIPDLTPLVDGVLDLDTLARIIGKAGSGKSFLALDLACHVATGRPWHGHETTPGRVCYVAAEGAAGFKNRVRAWEKHHGSRLGDQLMVLPLPVQASDGSAWSALITTLVEMRPVLVVIDTQARVTVGWDENSPEMGHFVQRVEAVKEQTHACVLVVHHKGHQGDHGRGHTVVFGALECEISVDKPSPGRVNVTNPKQKDEAEFDLVRLEMLILELGTRKLPTGRDKTVTSVVLVPEGQGSDAWTPADLVGPESDARDRLAKIIYRYFNGSQPGTKAEVRGLAMGAQAVERDVYGEPMSKASFYKAWKALYRDGALVQLERNGRALDRWVLSHAEAVRLGFAEGMSGSVPESGESHVRLDDDHLEGP